MEYMENVLILVSLVPLAWGPTKRFLSMGDPKQFLIAGSIGDRRVRILVDTGATISFIKSSLVPLLTPSPKVENQS